MDQGAPSLTARARFPKSWAVRARLATVAGFAFLALHYLWSPISTDHAEPSIIAIAANYAHGHPLYHGIDSGVRYSIIYGPLVFLLPALFMKLLGYRIWVAKLPFVLSALAVAPAMQGVFRRRLDPPLARAVSLGLLTGLATNVKAYAPALFVPIFLSRQGRHGLWVACLAFGVALGAVTSRRALERRDRILIGAVLASFGAVWLCSGKPGSEPHYFMPFLPTGFLVLANALAEGPREWAGNPLVLDESNLIDAVFDRIALPPATYRILEDCRVGIWLIPRGQAPFLMPSAMTPTQRILPLSFRRQFETSYRDAGHSEFYDLWECRGPGTLTKAPL